MNRSDLTHTHTHTHTHIYIYIYLYVQVIGFIQLIKLQSYLPFCVYKIQSQALRESATLSVLENKGAGANVQI